MRGRFRCFLQSMSVPSSAMPGRMFSLFLSATISLASGEECNPDASDIVAAYPEYTEMLAW